MQRHKQFVPLVTVSSTFEPFNEPDHSHTYYEIIYIKSGTGQHYVNGETVAFSAGSLFLIAPSDVHHFEAKEESVFALIQFTESFITENSSLPADWTKDFLQLISNQVFKYDMFRFEPEQQDLLAHIFDCVIASRNDENIVLLQVLSIIEVLKKAMSSAAVVQTHSVAVANGKFEELLTYIHQNITNPQRLKIDGISNQFGISHHYVSSYFKRNMGLTLRQYIDKYRMAILQKRLVNSEFTVKEIAYDFGFTDESHLNKHFKRFWGMSARAYRDMNG